MREMALVDTLLEVTENIRSITDLVDAKVDCVVISAVHDRIDKESIQRRKELEKAHANLKALARVLDAARMSSTRPPSVPSAGQHAKRLNHLDAARISLAKALNDADSSVTSKQAELTRLKEELRELEESDSAAEYELDGTALRLQIYRGLGMEPILNDCGELDRVLVESSSPSHNIHLVKFGTGTLDEELVEQIWGSVHRDMRPLIVEAV